VPNLALLEPQGLRVVIKVKLLELREDLVKVKTSTATINHSKATVEEGTLVEVVGGEADGDAMDSTKTGVLSALQTRWSSGIWTLHGRIQDTVAFHPSTCQSHLITPAVSGSKQQASSGSM
jgi:hypothetical protein